MERYITLTTFVTVLVGRIDLDDNLGLVEKLQRHIITIDLSCSREWQKNVELYFKCITLESDPFAQKGRYLNVHPNLTPHSQVAVAICHGNGKRENDERISVSKINYSIG